MALQATHLRFAHALSDSAGILDERAYYSGAVYPDSRYVTGIDRRKTHRENVPLLPFSASMGDFHKGWATHLYYDEHASVHLRALFGLNERIHFGGNPWIMLTSAKIIEDIESFRRLGEDRAKMQAIALCHAPCGEDQTRLALWYDSQKAIYGDGEVDFPRYERSFINTPNFPTEPLREAVADLQKNDKLVADIHGIFDHVLEEYERLRSGI